MLWMMWLVPAIVAFGWVVTTLVARDRATTPSMRQYEDAEQMDALRAQRPHRDGGHPRPDVRSTSTGWA